MRFWSLLQKFSATKNSVFSTTCQVLPLYGVVDFIGLYNKLALQYGYSVCALNIVRICTDLLSFFFALPGQL